MAAFLQAKELEREIYMVPPKDVKKESVIWKLKKPLYGLNDASRKFWLNVKEVFRKMGLKKLDGDEALYFKKNKEGDLEEGEKQEKIGKRRNKTLKRKEVESEWKSKESVVTNGSKKGEHRNRKK